MRLMLKICQDYVREFHIVLTPQNLLLRVLPEEKPAFVKIYSFIWMVNV